MNGDLPTSCATYVDSTTQTEESFGDPTSLSSFELLKLIDHSDLQEELDNLDQEPSDDTAVTSTQLAAAAITSAEGRNRIFTMAHDAVEAIYGYAHTEYGTSGFQILPMKLLLDFENRKLRVSTIPQHFAELCHGAEEQHPWQPKTDDASLRMQGKLQSKMWERLLAGMAAEKQASETHHHLRTADMTYFTGKSIHRRATTSLASRLRDSIHKTRQTLRTSATFDLMMMSGNRCQGCVVVPVDRYWLHQRNRLVTPGSSRSRLVEAMPVELRLLCRSLHRMELARREMADHLDWLESRWRPQLG